MLLKKGEKNAAARASVEYIKGEDARRVIAERGYVPTPRDTREKTRAGRAHSRSPLKGEVAHRSSCSVK